MSLSQKTADYVTTTERAERSRAELGSVLVLVCIALVLVIASVKSAPMSAGAQIHGEVFLNGP